MAKGGERAPARIADPRVLPTIRISGFLLEDAELGQQVRIRTIIGHEHAGKLRIENPGYGHSFAHTVPEFLHAGARA